MISEKLFIYSIISIAAISAFITFLYIGIARPLAIVDVVHERYDEQTADSLAQLLLSSGRRLAVSVLVPFLAIITLCVWRLIAVFRQK